MKNLIAGLVAAAMMLSGCMQAYARLEVPLVGIGGVASEPESEKSAEPFPEGETDMSRISEQMSETVSEQQTEQEIRTDGPIPQIVDNELASEEALGAKWAVSVEDLETSSVYGYRQDESMQSASVIKIFIMMTVFDRILYPEKDKETIAYTQSEGELDSLLSQMITVSSNEAANSLVSVLGGGDFEKGKEVVNEYCLSHGFSQCHLGRRFMAENPTDDNYISADDVRRALSEIYHGTAVNEQASARMMEYLRGQQTLYKIPAGLSEGYTTANKTGEMPDGYGLGSIENDACICMGPYGDFILVVLSNDIGSRTSQADQTITRIASETAAWYAQQAQSRHSETSAGAAEKITEQERTVR